MSFLLDTHIWLWALLDPGRLSRRTTHALEDSDNQLWLSPISVWELMMLVDRGHIFLKGDVDEWIAEAFERAPLHEATITNAIAMETISVRLPHRDPADRLLVATARVLDLTLVTADERLIGPKCCALLANK